jgi:hypothetical protein
MSLKVRGEAFKPQVEGNNRKESGDCSSCGSTSAFSMTRSQRGSWVGVTYLYWELSVDLWEQMAGMILEK